MELDKRVVEYASLILNDANILLNENSNLSPRQRKYIEQIAWASGNLIEAYNQYANALTNRVMPHEWSALDRDISHDLGELCTVVKTRLYLVEKIDSTVSWTEAHKSILVNIEHASSLIWIERYRFDDYLIP